MLAFPSAFKETLALHHDRLRQRGASFLFESSWKKPYSDRGVRRLLERHNPEEHMRCELALESSSSLGLCSMRLPVPPPKENNCE
jgi:integrase/recombinase XerD